MNAWLIDKSAYVRVSLCPDAEKWATRARRGLVRITTITLLEIGFSARSARDYRVSLEERPLAEMPMEYITPTIEDRALAVQRALADIGRHRAPAIPDLLIAATAEAANLTVLHVDKDYELIAEITGQPTERLRLP